MERNNEIVSAKSLIQDIRKIIEQACGHVASTANYTLSMMYWHIGERVNAEVLKNKRAEYGKKNCRITVTTIKRRVWGEGI